MTQARPQKLKMFKGPLAPPNNAIHKRLIQPAFGPASKIQAIAPRKLGITKAANTLRCVRPRSGMLVRDTASASGTPSASASSVTAPPSISEFNKACRWRLRPSAST